MSKRNSKPRSGRNPKYLIGIWSAAAVSALILYLSASAFMADIGTLRPCSSNNTGLSVSNCGKQGINLGDFVLLAIFIASAALAASLFTAAWRTTRKAQS